MLLTQEKEKRLAMKGLQVFRLVAGVGFEPHGLRVMSPTSYQAALPRDMKFRRSRNSRLVPATGIEPVRYSRITGF